MSGRKGRGDRGKVVVEESGKTLRRGAALWIVRAALGALLLLLGLALLFGPNVIAEVEQRSMEERIQVIEQCSVAAEEDEEPAAASPEVVAEKEALHSYNEEVRLGLKTVNDPFGFDDVSTSALEKYGLYDGLVGCVSIPAADVRVPLYLGASKSILSKGAGVISGTSAPLGEAESNCVIAGHRSTVFRRITSLSAGDAVELTTPWETLHYRVVQTKVIKPSNVEPLAVQQGRDLVTLFTCHPYGKSTSRYLVICERDEAVQMVERGPVERVVSFFESVVQGTVTVEESEDALKVGVLVVLLAVVVLEVALFVRRRVGK